MNSYDKQMVINTIIKLVDSSPSKKFRSYMNQPTNYEITQPELSIWLNYINSTLDVLYGYSGLSMLYSVKAQIMGIASQGNLPNIQRVLDIERVLLDLSRDILRYY